jgi:hypothetical protein
MILMRKIENNECHILSALTEEVHFRLTLRTNIFDPRLTL